MRTILTLLLLSGLAFGDVVHLRNGGKIEGKVTDKGDRIEVETANGKVTVEKDLIERIEKKDFAPPKGMGSKKPAKLGAPYAHPFYAFKLYLPPKWQYGKSSGNAAASFWGPKDQLYQPRMDLFYQTSKKELVDFVTAYKDAFRKSVKDVTFVYEEASAIRDKQAYQFSVTFTDGELPVVQQALFTFIADGDRRYVLGFNTSQAWFDRYYPVVDASMRSFRVYPASPLSPEDRKKVLVLDPTFEPALTNLGVAYLGKDQNDLARVTLEKALTADPESAPAHYNLGLAFERLDRKKDAEREYKEALSADPKHEDAKKALDRVRSKK